jgi:pyruvate dehydrogenase E2 component (dihydrolipoamide acetyltransferase)
MATPVIMPRQGQSVESCILTEWKVQPGDTVAEGDVLAVIETDKASFDLESTAAGTVLDLFWEADDDVPVLANVLAIGEEGENIDEFRPVDSGGTSAPEPVASSTSGTNVPAVETTAQPQETIPPIVGSASAPSAGISPRARKKAMRAGVDAEILVGTGPGGRVIERDVDAFLAGTPRLSATARIRAQKDGLEAPSRGSGIAGMALSSDMRQPGAIDGADVEPVKGIRKLIADRMMQSLQGTAQLTLHSSFDATACQQYRKKRLADGESKVSINDLVAKAILSALKIHPEMNAHFLGDRLAVFHEVNLGIAVDSPRGLMVPVVEDASQMSLEMLSSEIKKKAIACRDGTIQPDDLSGGTFTLTNLGMLGVENFTPVLNPPEIAILGVGGISVQPKRQPDGEVSFVDQISLSLTIDHQAIDGAPAARFLQTFVNHLETHPGENPPKIEGEE